MAMADADEGTFAWSDMGWGSEYSWRYRVLSEPEITSQLALYANAQSNPSAAVSSVSFQPCLNQDERSQDRHVVQSWDFGSGPWVLTAVFDGHAGHETANHAVVELPSLIKRKLQLALSDLEKTTSSPTPALVSSILANAVVDYDESLLSDLSALFPGGLAGVSRLTATEVEDIINDQKRGGENFSKVHRCMHGSTALVSLVDPSKENLWVANLGDCQAVLGTKTSEGTWGATALTSDHNGSNRAEVKRLREEHPNEPECILRRRVLGALAVTRALGDFEFKLPANITEDVFLVAKPGFSFKIASIFDWIGRSFTPPYLSHQPEVHHHKIIKGRDAFVIMCSDGLGDLFDGKKPPELFAHWAAVVGPVVEKEAGENAALALLREAIGGKDLDKVSMMMTLENTERWMDDTTITVQKL